jgi:hexosaminidase
MTIRGPTQQWVRLEHLLPGGSTAASGHIGGDEYLPDATYASYPQLQAYARMQYGPGANAKDALHGFFDWANAIVRAHGKRARIWNDDLAHGSAVTLDRDLVVEWWADTDPESDLECPSVQSLLDAGYPVMNASSNPTYYNAGPSGHVIPTADPQSAYEHWQVSVFQGPAFIPKPGDAVSFTPPQSIDAAEPLNLGAEVHVWGSGETEASIAEKIFPRLRVMAQKTWDSPQLTDSYAEFAGLIEAIGRAPGYMVQ